MGLNGELKTLFEQLCSRGNSQFASKMTENESHEVSAARGGVKIGLGFWVFYFGGVVLGLFYPRVCSKYGCWAACSVLKRTEKIGLMQGRQFGISRNSTPQR